MAKGGGRPQCVSIAKLLCLVFFASACFFKLALVFRSLLAFPLPNSPPLHLSQFKKHGRSVHTSRFSNTSVSQLLLNPPPFQILPPIVSQNAAQFPLQIPHNSSSDSSLSVTDSSVPVTDSSVSLQSKDAGSYRNSTSHFIRINSITAYHSKSIFMSDYKDMIKNFRIYVYPYPSNGPFANIFLPQKGSPAGNYASEAYFKKALLNSRLKTEDPSQAHLFYLPFSVSAIRHEKGLGVPKIPSFVADYMQKITAEFPYWNRSRGADHFYVACHSISKIAAEKANYLAHNAIQVICSSNYFWRTYIPHKDVPIPQIWPRQGTPARAGSTAQRKILAFFAGGANSPVRAFLVNTWKNDPDVVVHPRRISTPYSATPYSEALLTSKFCLHVKGFEVNTARIGDAMFYGCVPVIIADHYELPFLNILNWSQFSIVITTPDIPRLKEILVGVSPQKYKQMHQSVMQVRHHFQWHSPPVEYDAFYMVMYELWLKRHSLRPSLYSKNIL